jgi:hypothetical protein
LNYEHLLYKRGYLFSQAKTKPPIPTWTQKTIGDYFISFDPENQWAFAQKDDNWVALLGRTMDILHLTSDTDFISGTCLDRLILSEEKLLDYIDYLSGRFILIYHHGGTTKLMNDAFGTRSVFYSLKQPITVASHCGIFRDHLKSLRSTKIGAIRQDDRWHTGSNYGYPGNLTPFQGIYILTPNTLINIEARKIQRFYPRKKLPAGNLSDVVEEVSTMMKRQMELLNRENNLVISLSSGIDSRTTLAAARDIAKEALFFTYGDTAVLSSLPMKLKTLQVDMVIASDLAQSLGLNHICLDAWPKNKDDDFKPFNQVLNRNTYHRHNRRLAKAYLYRLPPDTLHIRSNLGGIAKSFFRRYGFNDLPLTAERMAQCWKRRMGDNELVVAAYRQFARVTQFTKIKNYDPYDMFFWEHYYGTWLPNVLLESDVAFDSFELLNSRAIAGKILSVPVQDRLASAVHLEIMRRLWPVLLAWPINQPPFRIQLQSAQAKREALEAKLNAARQKLEKTKSQRNERRIKLKTTRQKLEEIKSQQHDLGVNLKAVKSSFSYRMGGILTQAVRKPGRNTILLPYHLLQLLNTKPSKRTAKAARLPAVAAPPKTKTARKTNDV